LSLGAFGRGFLGDLAKDGPTPIGAQKANLSAGNLPYMEEVALNEQVRQFPGQLALKLAQVLLRLQ